MRPFRGGLWCRSDPAREGRFATDTVCGGDRASPGGSDVRCGNAPHSGMPGGDAAKRDQQRFVVFLSKVAIRSRTAGRASAEAFAKEHVNPPGLGRAPAGFFFARETQASPPRSTWGPDVAVKSGTPPPAPSAGRRGPGGCARSEAADACYSSHIFVIKAARVRRFCGSPSISRERRLNVLPVTWNWISAIAGRPA